MEENFKKQAEQEKTSPRGQQCVRLEMTNKEAKTCQRVKMLKNVKKC